jgi:uncharacterized protein (TIGR02444 family)
MAVGAPDGLWDFAVAVYGRPGVAAVCLDLQDRRGVDVPLLLWAAWLGRRGIGLDAARLEQAAAAVRPWRDEVVLTLRGLRRRLKSGPASAPGAATVGFREEIKALELRAERIQLDMLAELAAAWRPEPGTTLERNLAVVLGPAEPEALAALGAACR